jgi:hypothetical protein
MAEQRLIIRYQNTTGGLGPETFYDKFPVWQGRVRIADMDNDGDNDLVVVSGQNELAIIKQDSSTTPGTLRTVPDRYAVQPEGPFAVGDLNNDGKNDLAVIGSGNSGFTSVFLQNKGGALNSPTLLPTPSIIPWAGATISDINRDGLDDIVSASVDPGFPAGANIFVMYQSPAHTFSAITTYSFPTLSGGGGTVTLVTGDVTGDGKADVTMTWMDEGLFVMPSTFP